MRLEEMALKDLEGIDLTQDPKKIAKEYFKNYKERTGKEITKQAITAFKKTLERKLSDEKVDEIVKAAQEEFGTIGIKTQKQKDEIMSKNVKAAAKKAYDVYKESFKDKMLRNAGMIKED